MARETCTAAGRPGTQKLPREIAAGDLVAVRGRRCRLTSWIAHHDCVELHLAGRPDDVARLLWPFDRPVPAAQSEAVRVRRPRAWVRWLLEQGSRPGCGALRVRTVPPVDLIAYQLAPALAIRSGRCRLLLADEVGLGKTIEAGWIVADTLAADVNARVLVAVPAGLRDQWASELAARFAVPVVIADARWLKRTSADLPPDVNPWSLPGVVVTSIDFLKRPEVVRACDALAWDVVVADEVHAAAGRTDRCAALQRVAARARAVVLITATPYSGDAAAFASIQRIGARASDPPLLMFRRSRADVGGAAVRHHRFTAVRITAAERRLHRLLDRYTRLVWREADADSDRARLAMIVLRKRALSSAAAAAVSIDRRREWIERRSPAPVQLPLFEDDEIHEDEEPDGVLAVPGLADEAAERRWLNQLGTAARDVHNEAKLRFLQRLVRRLRGESAVVFTEYRDTLQRIAAAVGADLLLHGGLSAEERVAVVGRFTSSGGILVATDAAAEGLNLQARCRLVINFELPWNPSRLEQRIGRVDRIGQRRPVHAITLVARDTAEDLVLARFARRLARAAEHLGRADRMALLLTEARAAQLVITGSLPPPVEVAAPAAALEGPADDLSLQAEREAARFEMRRLACDPSSTGIPVTVIDGRRSRLGTGAILVAAWTISSANGEVVHQQTVPVRVEMRVRPPRSASAARALAQRLVDDYGDSVCAEAARRTACDVAARHDRAVAAALAREAAMAALSEPPAVQPGLFDRRALAGREAADRAETFARGEHADRLRRLDESRALHGRWRIAGVLIVGRE